MNLSCFHSEFQNKRLMGEGRTVAIGDPGPEIRGAVQSAVAEGAPRQPRRNPRAEQQGLRQEIDTSIEEKKASAQSEINETRQAFDNAHLEAGMGLGTVQPAVENLQTRLDELTAHPDPQAFETLGQDAITVRTNIQHWIRHRELMDQVRRRHLETDPRVVEIRRKLTAEGAEGQEARNTIGTQNEALQNILAPAEQVQAPAPAPGEQPAAPEQPSAQGTPPETPAEQNENPTSPISTVSAFLGGGLLGATGEKIGKFLEGAWESVKHFVSRMSVTFRYALGLSPERLRSWGITTSPDDLYPEGTGLSWWEVAGMSPAQLRLFTKAAGRLAMISEATRGPILKMKFSEFAAKLPTQLSSDAAEQAQLASLKTFLDNAGADRNQTLAVILGGTSIPDRTWAGYRPESAGTPNAPLVQSNQPGTPPERVNHFFASIRSEIHNFPMDAQTALRNFSAREIAGGRAIRPANVPERAWNTIANALRGQEIADPNMNVAQFLQQKFQNPNYNPAIATA